MGEPAPATRDFTVLGKERIAQAWAKCLANRPLDATEICEAVVAEVKGQLDREDLFLDRDQGNRLFFQAGGVHVTLYLEQTDGLKEFLDSIKKSLLNGWPFKEAKKKAPQTPEGNGPKEQGTLDFG